MENTENKNVRKTIFLSFRGVIDEVREKSFSITGTTENPATIWVWGTEEVIEDAKTQIGKEVFAQGFQHRIPITVEVPSEDDKDIEEETIGFESVWNITSLKPIDVRRPVNRKRRVIKKNV